MFIQKCTRVSKQPYHCSLARHALIFNRGPKSPIFTPKQDDNWGSPRCMDMRQLTNWQRWKSTTRPVFPFYKPKAWERYPSRAGSPRMCHSREYWHVPPGNEMRYTSQVVHRRTQFQANWKMLFTHTFLPRGPLLETVLEKMQSFQLLSSAVFPAIEPSPPNHEKDWE